LVVLLDVDNTLLDNDRFAVDLSAFLLESFGAEGRDRYWRLFAQRREDLGYADYLGALEAFRGGYGDLRDRTGLAAFILDYPFAERLYPGALAVLARLRAGAPTVIFTEGDLVFQPHKVRRAGIWDAAQGQVIVCLHKPFALAQLRRQYPATHYLMIDDKPFLLAAMKRLLGSSLTTVFVHQGQYAQAAQYAPHGHVLAPNGDERHEPARTPAQPVPDVQVERIADLLGADPNQWMFRGPAMSDRCNSQTQGQVQ
jgi:FMN phosphatase YigB (HAD superfamily)